jgi:hypothetical protein
MKTKTFLFLCLFIGIGLTQLSAQNVKNGTGAVPQWVEWTWVQPVYCNGVQIDDLSGHGTAHVIDHYKDGELLYSIVSYDGVYESTVTDEEFKILSTNEKDVYTPLWTTAFHYNLIGNKGSHYIGAIYMDINGTFIVEKALCLENGPKK